METFTTPFPHIIIKNFLDAEVLKAVQQAVEQLPFERKESDLFSLEQTADLTDEPGLEVVRQKIMGLREEIKHALDKDHTSLDMSAMKYTEGDHLLCHDDQLESRKVAYILYLKAPKKGGELLFRKTEEPYDVEVTIKPEENLLVLFEVSEKSWHEVAEVIKGERLSVGGWLH